VVVMVVMNYKVECREQNRLDSEPREIRVSGAKDTRETHSVERGVIGLRRPAPVRI
jgi:hypothetical protein